MRARAPTLILAGAALKSMASRTAAQFAAMLRDLARAAHRDAETIDLIVNLKVHPPPAPVHRDLDAGSAHHDALPIRAVRRVLREPLPAQSHIKDNRNAGHEINIRHLSPP
jgi:hypothetical protein